MPDQELFQPVVEQEDTSQKPLVFPLKDKDLPPIIREVVGNAPQNRKLPCFVACLSPLCALAPRVRLQYYYDGTRPSALLLQVIIEAPQSCGKQFAADIEKLIMDNTLKAQDQQQRRLEQDYREKKKRRKANEKLEEEPRTTIRVIPATISKTVLVKRADFYERNLGDIVFFWMFAEELAQVTDAGKQGYSNLRTIMRTAYDLGSRFGMDFASDNSYSAIVDINICSMFCSTASALDEYMDRRAIEGGNITRTVLCQLDDQLGADGAMFRPYTSAQMEAINRMLSRLMDETYDADGNLRPIRRLDTSWLDKDVRKWCVSKGQEALQCGSYAIDVFRKRASVSAFRIAALCYYLYLLEENEIRTDANRRQTECNEASFDCRGAKEEKPEGVNDSRVYQSAQKRCRRIYYFMADYILNTLLKRWGKTFEELQSKRFEGIVETSRPKLIDRLGKDFTRDQLRALIQELKVATPDRVLISQWKANKWIEQTDKFQYRKLI